MVSDVTDASKDLKIPEEAITQNHSQGNNIFTSLLMEELGPILRPVRDTCAMVLGHS